MKMEIKWFITKLFKFAIILNQIWSLLTIGFLVFSVFNTYVCYISEPFTVRHHLQADARGVLGRPLSNALELQSEQTFRRRLRVCE